MSDLLGDALARWDDNHPARPMTTFYYSQVVAAARKWHTLTNPTDELIERLIATLDQLPEHIGSDGITDAILDALRDTVEEAPLPPAAPWGFDDEGER